jgi:glycosyltransferase involved in cell wall biosynthesis
MSPFESGAAAARIAARLGVPWVADLRDPWALDEMQAYPSRVHRRRDLRRMREVLASASAVVMNTDEAARRVRSFSGLSGPVVAIPNGFDPDDFASPAPERTPGFFRIVHAGYLHTELARGGVARAVRGLLGGAVPGVDVGTRSHVYLLRAVERLLTADPALAGRIEVHLAGVLSEADLAEARRSSVVRLHGYVSHAATVELLRSADLLFLPMQNLPEGTRATIVPGKTYEYLAAGRPILAAVPDGDARDLLARVPTATLCRPADVAGIADAVLGELRRKDRGERLPEVPAALLAPFERQQLTARLADVFDAVLGVSPPLASADRVAV